MESIRIGQLSRKPLMFVWLVVVILFGCDSPPLLFDCANTVDSVVESPDKQLRAIVFERNCGATTGFSTQISIIKAGDTLPNEGGNVYVASGHLGRVGTEMDWAGSRNLLIHKTLTGAEFKAEHSWGWIDAVEIQYDSTAKVEKP